MDKESIYAIAENIRREVHSVALSMPPHYVKVKKPATINLPNGINQAVRTWKQVVSLILKDCNANPQMHEKLLALRDAISGRSRSMLSSLPDGMVRPLKIDEGIFLESCFDT